MTCKRCIPIECDGERYDQYSLQDSLFIVMRFQGCLSTVERTLSSSATATQIAAAKAAIEAEVLAQNAICYPEVPEDPTTPLRLSIIPPCCCVGTPLNVRISVTGGEEPYVYKIISGSLPAGLSLSGGDIAGTPSAGGAQTFTVKVWDAAGQTAQAEYTLNALNITTNSCPNFTVGVPYSHYLSAVGGSGSYLYKLLSGELPDGIVLEANGWLHGTPTGANGTSQTVTFSCIDTACQQGDRTFYTPRVGLSTVSTHTVATVRGFTPFNGANTRYRTATYTGTSEQWAREVTENGENDNGPIIAHARYEWSGASEINFSGAVTSTHTKNFYAPCGGGDEPEIYYAIAAPSGTGDFSVVPNLIGVSGYPLTLRGYCLAADPTSCSPCADPIVLIADRAVHGSTDGTDLITAGMTPVVNDVTRTLVGSSQARLYLSPTKPLEYIYLANNIVWCPINVYANHNYTITLSNEYTDAIALANADVYASNSNTAVNSPRGTGLVATYAAVTYTLNFSNLVPGENYAATVRFRNKLKVTTYRTHTFTATGTTHSIVDTVPTPAVNDTITVDAPRVAYA